MTTDRHDHETLIGHPYDAAVLARFDWHTVMPEVGVNEDTTVGRIRAMHYGDDSDQSVSVTGVTIQDGRVISAGGDHDVDAYADIGELRAAGFAVDDAE